MPIPDRDHSEACIVSSSRAIHVTTLAHSPLSRRNCCEPFLLPPPTPLDLTIVPFTHQFNRAPQLVTVPLAPRALGDSIVSAPATLDSLLFARCASQASVECKARSDGQRQHPLTPRSSHPSSWPNIGQHDRVPCIQSPFLVKRQPDSDAVTATFAAIFFPNSDQRSVRDNCTLPLSLISRPFTKAVSALFFFFSNPLGPRIVEGLAQL